MIIQTDKEGKDVIEQLCDIALKQGGVSNLNQVNAILKSVVVAFMPVPPAIKEDPQPKSPLSEKEEKAEAKKKTSSKSKNAKKKKDIKTKK